MPASQASTATAASEKTDHSPAVLIGAAALVAMMLFLSIAMWLGVPIGWLWIGSQVTHEKLPTLGIYALVGSGITISVVLSGLALKWLEEVFSRLTGHRPAPRSKRAPWLEDTGHARLALADHN